MYDLTLNPGVSLNRNLKQSLAWSKSQREVATLISGSYAAGVVAKWREMLDKFDRDPSMPNPYKEVEERTTSLPPFWYLIAYRQPLDLTIAELQKELLKERKLASNANSLSTDTLPSSISPGTFFQKAIEVEDRL